MIWETGDAILPRFAPINWRARLLPPGSATASIAPFQRVMREYGIDENELIAQSAAISEWSGSSIREELIRGADNMGALSWLNFGHARHGDSDRIQGGVYFRTVIRKIRIPPLLTAGS